MKTFYQIFSIQINTVLSEYTTSISFCNKYKTYGMKFLGNTMASRIFRTSGFFSHG